MKKFTLMFILLIILAGCGIQNKALDKSISNETVNTPLYSGKNLVIGVIGDSPSVRENNVKFENIDFTKLAGDKNLSSEYDAVFIMKEHLSQASNSIYAKVYKNSGIPFFYIGSTKSYIPFVNEQLSYKDVPDMKDQTYATGYFQSGEGKYQCWGYGLYNDKINESNIKDVYSRIFTTIESIK
ncbi:hypothetical protein [Neobacillus endophyticus]|uniref:hypothetical protein n=1 Tax=Neobacillus endophyticus TaxID=2738405 RepID=UPI001C264997|nr:hypothetical protein [Neobacillus endophyticus]